MNVTAWVVFVFFFFFKQKTAYEMRISDWSSDVCSSDLTSKPFRTLLEERLGPVSYFIGGQNGMPYKPRADSTPHILFEKGWQRSGVLYVGNTTDDMKTAANIGRASWWGKGCRFWYDTVVAGSLKKKIK